MEAEAEAEAAYFSKPEAEAEAEAMKKLPLPDTLFQCIRVTIELQHFDILGYHRIAILQYIANYLFLQRTLTVYSSRLKKLGKSNVFQKRVKLDLDNYQPVRILKS